MCIEHIEILCETGWLMKDFKCAVLWTLTLTYHLSLIFLHCFLIKLKSFHVLLHRVTESISFSSAFEVFCKNEFVNSSILNCVFC